jgi:hypothetical protein
MKSFSQFFSAHWPKFEFSVRAASQRAQKQQVLNMPPNTDSAHNKHC